MRQREERFVLHSWRELPPMESAVDDGHDGHVELVRVKAIHDIDEDLLGSPAP